MRANRRVQLLVAALAAALVLVVLSHALHSGPRAGVTTHEIRDLIATLQAPLEADGATHGNSVAPGGTLRLLVALLAGAALVAGLATVHRVRRQQHDRNRSS